MKVIMFMLLLASWDVPTFAKKIPADRMQFAHEYKKVLERADYGNVGIDITGKEKDVLELWLIHASVASMQRFEQECVEPAKDSMRRAGFRTVRIFSGEPSESYPNGNWDIPIE